MRRDRYRVARHAGQSSGAMANVAEWTVTEASGRQHRVVVRRTLIFGAQVTVDRRALRRFDQTPESDRHVTSIGGHVLTVVIPRVTNDQPTLHCR